MCLFAVVGLGLRYFETPLAVRFGHPLRYPHRIALRGVEMRRLHRDWWAKRILLVSFLGVCVKKVICVAEWAWALATTGAADGSMRLACWEVMPSDPNGSVHKSVAGSFSPCKIISSLYRTIHWSCVNVTSHPASVSTLIPKVEAMDRSGMICPVRTKGRPLI
jgi:hypothetical protein